MLNFDRYVVTAAVLQMLPVKMGLATLFFGGKEEPAVDTEHVLVDIYKDKRRVAKYTKRGAEGQQVEDIGFEEVPYKPPLIFEEKPTNAHRFFSRDVGETPTSSGMSGEDRAYRKLGKDFEEMKRTADRAKIKQVADVLMTGKIVANESGVDRTIDFSMKSTHKVTLSGTDVWTDLDNSNPIEDMRAWQALVAEDSGMHPDAAVFGKEAMGAWWSHPKVIQYYDVRNFDVSKMTAERRDDGLIYYGHFEGTDLYVFQEWLWDEETSRNVPVISDGKVVLGATDAKVSVHFAGLEDSEDEYVYIAAEREIAKTYVDKKTSTMYAQYKTAPLYALSQADAFMNAEVI